MLAQVHALDLALEKQERKLEKKPWFKYKVNGGAGSVREARALIDGLKTKLHIANGDLTP